MNYTYEIAFLDSVDIFINKLPIIDRAKIAVAITCMREGDFQSVHIKTLHREIKELIVKRYRLIFLIKGKIIYIIIAFIKKSRKTPIVKIEQAKQLSKLL